jgi:hypothetical protein
LDLTGSMQRRSIQGSFYMATFIDDYSRHGLVSSFISKLKISMWPHSRNSWLGAENQTSERSLVLHSDHRGVLIRSC